MAAAVGRLYTPGGVKYNHNHLVIGVPRGSTKTSSKRDRSEHDAYIALIKRAEEEHVRLYMVSHEYRHVDTDNHFKIIDFLNDKAAAKTLRANGVSGINSVIVTAAHAGDSVTALLSALFRLVNVGVVLEDAAFTLPASAALTSYMSAHPAQFIIEDADAADQVCFSLSLLEGSREAAVQRSAVGTMPPDFYTKAVAGRGLGLFCAQNIPAGAYLGEYLGKIVSNESAERLVDNKYLFDVMEPPGSRHVKHVIDGGDQATSSFARWVNVGSKATINVGFVQERFRIFLRAQVFIPADSEILAWYGQDTARLLEMRGGGRKYFGLLEAGR